MMLTRNSQAEVLSTRLAPGAGLSTADSLGGWPVALRGCLGKYQVFSSSPGLCSRDVRSLP